MVKSAAGLLLVLVFAACWSGTAVGAEEIRNFHARVEIGADGTLTVTETIDANAEGRQISRGIFRDIPLRYEDAGGRMREARLEIRSVTRNGNPETYVTERQPGLLRIRIGNSAVMLPYGGHSWRIAYTMTRQIRHFDAHDELYWNVTGTEWSLPILRASAEIVLPGAASATDVTYFTGPYGSTEQAARATRLDGGNRIRVEATRPFRPREGLSVVVAFPKGVVAPPSAAELRADWWQDNRGWIVGTIGSTLR